MARATAAVLSELLVRAESLEVYERKVGHPLQRALWIARAGCQKDDGLSSDEVETPYVEVSSGSCQRQCKNADVALRCVKASF